MAGRAGRSEGLHCLVRGRLMAAQASLIADVLAKSYFNRAGLDQRSMAGIALLSGERVHGRKRSAGIRDGVAAQVIAEKPQNCERGKRGHQNSASKPPASPSLEVMEVVPLSETFGCTFTSHDSSSVLQGYDCVNCAHYQQRERQRDVNEQPSMQHAVHAGLVVQFACTACCMDGCSLTSLCRSRCW